MEEEKRKLIKFSNYSLCVTLPKWVIKNLNWKKGDSVNMEVDPDKARIIISACSKSQKKPSKQLKSTKKSDQLRW